MTPREIEEMNYGTCKTARQEFEYLYGAPTDIDAVWAARDAGQDRTAQDVEFLWDQRRNGVDTALWLWESRF